MIYSSNFNDPSLIQKISKVSADIFVYMGLDRILKESFIKVFDKACLNTHPSKLPDFRGPDSIFQFLLSPAESAIGVCLHKMHPKIDEGDIIMIHTISRKSNDNHLSLLRKSIEIGCN